MTQVAFHQMLWFFKTFRLSYVCRGRSIESQKGILCVLRMMNQEMFTLSNNLPSLKSEKFQQMRSFPTDCTLVCKNGRVTAHRLILGAASTFFMANIAQSSGGHIFLPQYDAQDIRLIIDFIYGLSVTVDYDRMTKLVDIAHNLGISVFDNGGSS